MLPSSSGSGGSSSDKLTDNLLSISWHDSAWIPLLGPHNVMDYFSERSNPFYDRTCNNEVIKMQRASLDQLQAMQGVEYCLLHVQEPILYVIRKQQRHSPTQITPISDYYIMAGIVYQAPDLCSVLNSRLLTTVTHLQSAFDEARQYARYHPSRGYWWEFEKGSASKFEADKKKKLKAEEEEEKAKKTSKKKELAKKAKAEPSSLFQRRRVDYLLDLLTKQFPPKIPAAAPAPAAAQPALANAAGAAGAETVPKTEVDIKSEKESVKSEKPEASSAATGATGVKREAGSGSAHGRPEAKRMKTS